MKSPAKVFENISRKFKGAGIIMIMVSFNVSGYYSLIETFCIKFLIDSFKYPLPWASENPQESYKKARVFVYFDFYS